MKNGDDKIKSKAVSINQNSDFKRVYYRGKFKSCNLLTTYAMKNKRNITRVGITASKKIGNAVKRNRARRIIRASFMELFKEEKFRGFDFIFVARRDTVSSKTTFVKRVMKKQIFSLI